MAEVMFEMVAFGLEGIVILVLNLPTSATGLNNLSYVIISKGVAGHKGVMVNHLLVRTADSYLTPVHQQRIRRVFEGQVIEISVSPSSTFPVHLLLMTVGRSIPSRWL